MKDDCDSNDEEELMDDEEELMDNEEELRDDEEKLMDDKDRRLIDNAILQTATDTATLTPMICTNPYDMH